MNQHCLAHIHSREEERNSQYSLVAQLINVCNHTRLNDIYVKLLISVKMTNNQVTKKPLKFTELALNKFTESAIPYHKNLLEERKNAVKQVFIFIIFMFYLYSDW